MKKIKKREMIKFINMFTDVNESIISTRLLDYEKLLNILTECQQVAIAIGNSIEEHYRSSNIVPLLEEYCEKLYELSLIIGNGNEKTKCCKKIRNILMILKNKLNYDLPDDRKEVVFLPYKASMWDSLESVWKKYKADLNCDTYVIPIPYFDKNPDGTIGEMHYEGNLYSQDIPITSYEEYIIADRNPDEIYIHNPYDGHNKITTVHPDFYAKELRKHTDLLIYIPYFVAVDSKVEKHFCTLPGVIYSNKVIVQSEKAREIYIQELRKLEEELNCKNVFGNIEEKIIAGGSPKFDKVIKSRKEDFPLTDEWKKLISKEDGKIKKIVMYNTTIKAMIKNPEKMMDKIESVFRIFKSNSEVVLIWRPHPLLKASLKSMREEYVERYEVIEKNYIREGWGIYDDSPDMYRAIIWSDAYYGDGGSVVEIYKKTGKPIMIQNIEII